MLKEIIGYPARHAPSMLGNQAKFSINLQSLDDDVWSTQISKELCLESPIERDYPGQQKFLHAQTQFHFHFH